MDRAHLLSTDPLPLGLQIGHLAGNQLPASGRLRYFAKNIAQIVAPNRHRVRCDLEGDG